MPAFWTTPRPPFSGSFRVMIAGKWSVVTLRQDIVVRAPRRVGFLAGLTMDLMMQMVAAKGGRMEYVAGDADR